VRLKHPQIRDINMNSNCRREGSKDPELYVQALTYMVGKVSVETHLSPSMSPKKDQHSSHTKKKKSGDSDSDDDDEVEDKGSDSDGEDGRWDDVVGILELIQKENILPTTQVANVLLNSL